MVQAASWNVPKLPVFRRHSQSDFDVSATHQVATDTVPEERILHPTGLDESNPSEHQPSADKRDYTPRSVAKILMTHQPPELVQVGSGRGLVVEDHAPTDSAALRVVPGEDKGLLDPIRVEDAIVIHKRDPLRVRMGKATLSGRGQSLSALANQAGVK